MSVTILDTLKNAQYNLIENRNVVIAFEIGKMQLSNAITLLEKGYSSNDEVDPLLERFDNVDNVPNK